MGKTKFYSIVAVLVCVAALTGCSGKATPKEERMETGAGSPPVAVPKTGHGLDDRPLIVAFGDSLTAGVSGRSYPEALQDLLDARGYKYRVENQGVSGDTTSDGLARIENVVAAKPALVLLEFGGNDGLRGVPVEATRANLQAMIERLQAAKIPLVLLGITLPPNYGPEYVKPFTAIFPGLAKEQHVKLMPFLLLHVYQNGGLMQPDGIHPNEEGNKIVAQDVFGLVQGELQK